MEGRREWDEEKDGSWQAEDPGCISCLISPCNQHGARCFLTITPPLHLILWTCEMEITLSSLRGAWEGQVMYPPFGVHSIMPAQITAMTLLLTCC